MSPELFARVFFESPDPVVIQDIRGSIMEMNREAETLYGWKREELAGMSMKKLVPPEGTALEEDLLRRCCRGEYIKNVEALRQSRGGDVFPVLLTLFPVSDETGKVTAIVTVAKNIAEQKQVERDLKTLSRVFQSILNNVSMCITTIDGDGIILQSAGSGFARMGLADNELYGIPFGELYPDGEHLLLRAFGGEVVTFLQSGESDGEAFFFQHTLFPGTEKGEGLVSIGIDVTELRELQRQVISISEEERENIGRELHDELGQVLTGVGYLVRALEEKISEGEVVDASEVATISGLVARALEQTRSLSRGLSRVQMQQDFSLALEEIVAELEDLYGVECVVSREGEIRIPDDTVATHLYYILKEAVHNAVKHGKTKRVAIELKVDTDSFKLRVLNRGNFSYFRPESARRGLGMRIMKYRADILGALFSVDTTDEYFAVSLNMGRHLLR